MPSGRVKEVFYATKTLVVGRTHEKRGMKGVGADVAFISSGGRGQVGGTETLRPKWNYTKHGEV